jgi:hypothetical protein
MDEDADAERIDGLAPAKGIIFSVLLGMVLWAPIIALLMLR